MRFFWILIILAIPCVAVAKNCKTTLGIDKNPPPEVKLQMEKLGLNNFQLIDRRVCKKTIRWFAIPEKYPANAPRPPGSEHWLILDLKSREVEFIPAPG